jgi:hypothetical protein
MVTIHGSLGALHGPGYPSNLAWDQIPYLAEDVGAHFDALCKRRTMEQAYAKLCAIYEWEDSWQLRYWLGFSTTGVQDVVAEMDSVETDHWVSHTLTLAEVRTDWRSVESQILAAYPPHTEALQVALQAVWGAGYDDEGEAFAYEQQVQSDLMSWEVARPEDKQSDLPVPYPERVDAWTVSERLEEEEDGYMPAAYWEMLNDAVNDGTRKGEANMRLLNHVLVRYFRLAERWERSEQRRQELLAILDLLDWYADELALVPFSVKLAVRNATPALTAVLDGISDNARRLIRRNRRHGDHLVQMDPYDADMDLMIDMQFWNGSDDPLPPIMPTIRAFIEDYEQDLWEKRKQDRMSVLIDIQPAARSPEFERTANYYAAIGTDYLECCARGLHAYSQFLGYEGTFEDFLLLGIEKPKHWRLMTEEEQMRYLEKFLAKVKKQKSYMAHVGRCYMQTSDLAYEEFMAWRVSMNWREYKAPAYRRWGKESAELWVEDPEEWIDTHGEFFHFDPALHPRR